MNTYILTEGTNLKTFLKEKYSIALDCCKKNIEHGFEHDVHSPYGVCMYIKHS